MGTKIRRLWPVLLGACTCSAVAAAAAAPGSVIVARPGQSTPLTLRDCVARALDGNDALRAERIRRRELDGQMRQALSTGIPTLGAAGMVTRSRDPSFALDPTFGGGGEPDGGTPAGDGTPAAASPLDSLLSGFSFMPAPEDIDAQTYWRTSLDVHWVINPLRVLAAVGAAGEARHHQELAITAAAQRTEQEVITAFCGIVLAAEQVEAVEARLANQDEFLDIMRLRFQLDMATALDTLQAAVAVANLHPRLRLARQGLRSAGANLNAIMGVDPGTPVTIRNTQHIELDPVCREAALELAAQRPDVRQLRSLEAMLRQNRRSQKADLMPFLALSGSYGLVSRRVAELDDKGHDFWNASAVLSVPLFDGLLTRGQMQETTAAIRRTQAQGDGLTRQVRREVLNLLETLDVVRENLSAARLNLERAEDLVETSALMLRHGQADYLTVLAAEAERAQARTQLIQARYDVLTTTAALKRALGVSPMLALSQVPGLTAQ